MYTLKRNKSKSICLVLGLTVLVLCACFSMCMGASGLSFVRINQVLHGEPLTAVEISILLHIRLPRILAACLCGAALAVSGLLLQSALGNALASPGTIGVNSGAGFAVVCSAALLPALPFGKVPFAFVGALVTALTIYAIAGKTGGSRIAIVLAGVAVSSLFSAGSDAIITLFPDSVADRTAFSIGGFGNITLSSVKMIAPFVAVGIIGSFLLAPYMNLLALGDEIASSLGINVKACRFIAIVLASLLAASAVSIAGLLGFIGLLAPHMVRMLSGHDARWQIPFSALGGAILLLLCDTIARTAFAPYELPVGIVLSFLGAPFFLYLLFNRKKGDLHDSV